MSVVAACSLLEGILIGADCRVTFRQPGREDIFVDNCLKLFEIGGSSAIGFVGFVPLASQMLRTMLSQMPNHRTDPVSLHDWLPRLFRYEFSKFSQTPKAQISFLVGSTIPSHGNIIERQAVVDLVNYMFFSKDRKIKSGWFDAKIIGLLNTPQDAELIGIQAPRNLLYRLDSPDFIPRRYMPLKFVAIGSGEKLKEKIASIREMIFAAHVGNYHMEAMWLCTAMESFLKEVDEQTVGGLFPMMKLEWGRVMRLGQNSKGYFPGGYDIRLEPMEDGSWVQKNLVTGKEIFLIPPWEIEEPSRSMKFDDFRYGMFG